MVKNNQQELKSISEHAFSKPIFLIELDDDEQYSLKERLYDSSRISIAMKRSQVKNLKLPCLALVFSTCGLHRDGTFVGVLTKKARVTSFDSRITIEHLKTINYHDKSALIALVTDKRLQSLLRSKIQKLTRGMKLSPRISSLMVESLSHNVRNRNVLNSLKRYLLPSNGNQPSENATVQADALNSALKMFGIRSSTVARFCDTSETGDTALSDVRVLEDSVIEHDARTVNEMQLEESSVTGTAIFTDRQRTLEIVTANKRPLEKVLGVDLIYINKTMSNVVLVQYKMLERKGRGAASRWLYRPDRQLKKEIQRMRSIPRERHTPSAGSFRLNDQAFYIKLVKRDSLESTAGIILPLDQFELELNDSKNRGARGAVLIDYQSLGGRYLRSAPFIELVKDGCIGTHDSEMEAWSALIGLLITGNRSVVLAIERDLVSST